MPVSRKPKPQPFQLKPKHLVTAVLSVCAAAIVAVIVGVVGTFNSHDKARPIEAQPKDETGTGRVEVLKPEGSGAVPAGGIVINPNAGGQHPTGITDDRMVPPAPINNGSPAAADSGSARQQPAPRRNASETRIGTARRNQTCTGTGQAPIPAAKRRDGRTFLGPARSAGLICPTIQTV